MRNWNTQFFFNYRKIHTYKKEIYSVMEMLVLKRIYWFYRKYVVFHLLWTFKNANPETYTTRNTIIRVIYVYWKRARTSYFSSVASTLCLNFQYGGCPMGRFSNVLFNIFSNIQRILWVRRIIINQILHRISLAIIFSENIIIFLDKKHGGHV